MSNFMNKLAANITKAEVDNYMLAHLKYGTHERCIVCTLYSLWREALSGKS